MNTISGSATQANTLFSKVSMLLTGSMAVAALGTFMGAGIAGGALIGLIILYLLATIGVVIAAKTAQPSVAVPLMFGWSFLSGLTVGPALNAYVHILGANTVMMAFLGTSGVMAVCGAVGMLSGINFSSMGRWLMLALFGLIIVGIIGIFVHMSAAVNMLYSGIGMLVFAGFFVFDFFRLKEENDDTWGSAIIISMNLHLDFVNFLLYLLQFLAAGKDDRK